MPRKTFAALLLVLAVLPLLLPGKAVAGPPEGVSGKMVLDEVADLLKKYRMERNDTHRIRLLRTLFKFSDLRAVIAVGEALNDSSKEVRQAAVQIVLFGYGGISYGIRAIPSQFEQVAQRWWEKNEADLRRRAKQLPQ